MKVDLSHPSNQAILRFLRNPYDIIAGPKSEKFRLARESDLSNKRVAENQSPDAIHELNLGTHPDIVDRFWRKITTLLPEPCGWVVYGSPVLVHPGTGIIFGWARGSADYSLRLPPHDRQRAVSAGAKTLSRYSDGDSLDAAAIGPDWILGNFIDAERDWCLIAYQAAGGKPS